MERDDNVAPTETGHRHAPEDKGGLSPFVKVAIVFCMLGGAVALLLFSTAAGTPFVYSKLVEEVLHEPKAFAGRELRVEGDLKQGSIQFKEKPCEWRFVIGKDGKEMPVHFPQCIVPDTFKDGAGLKVTVQGKLHEEGYFVANQVIPKCPSKYEMKKLQDQGMQMPASDMKKPGLSIPNVGKPTS